MTAVAFEALFLCHGSPRRDDEYLVRRVTTRGVEARPAEELAELVAAIPQSIVLCGHDHLPHLTPLPDDRLIIGPGSVGLPAYVDDRPWRHEVSAGSPHARYAILRKAPDAWDVEHVAVEYDHGAAAATARRNGRPDWAQWLETGRAAPVRRAGEK
jgi:diadenosine tetraphosphatase ApaH/serine/threonine PP2A family protein phosphatase